jgi:hypothetical protein
LYMYKKKLKINKNIYIYKLFNNKKYLIFFYYLFLLFIFIYLFIFLKKYFFIVNF